MRYFFDPSANSCSFALNIYNGVMLNRYAPLLLILAYACSVGCSTTQHGLEGTYSLCAETAGFSGERLILDNGKFSYWFYSDVGEPGQKYPVIGTYTNEGDILILNTTRVYSPRRHIDVVNNVPVLWRDDGYKLWMKEQEIQPYAVLIRDDRAQRENFFTGARPSITRLHSEEYVRRQEKKYEERYIDTPESARLIFRAWTERDDADRKRFIEEIEKARRDLKPELVNTLVELRNDGRPYRDEAERALRALYCGYGSARDNLGTPEVLEHNQHLLIDALSHVESDYLLRDISTMLLRQLGYTEWAIEIDEINSEWTLASAGHGTRQWIGRIRNRSVKSITDDPKEELKIMCTAFQKWLRTKVKEKSSH